MCTSFELRVYFKKVQNKISPESFVNSFLSPLGIEIESFSVKGITKGTEYQEYNICISRHFQIPEEHDTLGLTVE